MERRSRLALLCAAMALAASSASAQGVCEPSTEAPRALQHTYVHGVTEDEASRLYERCGSGVVPALRALLRDPAFPRRDNAVAFAAHLGDDAVAEELLRLLGAPPAGWSRPEEVRALLLAPEALGKIGSRGHREALRGVLALAGPEGARILEQAASLASDPAEASTKLLESVLRGLAWTGAEAARERLSAIAFGRAKLPPARRDLGRAALRALALFDELHAGPAGMPTRAGAGTDQAAPGETSLENPPNLPGSPRAPETFDRWSRVHDSGLDYANHVDLASKMTDSRLDDALARSNLRVGQADYTGDVACCVTLSRLGEGKLFGLPGDGLDVIDDGAELDQVMGDGTARVKVVEAIRYCGSPGFNIIGCAGVPGDGMVVVRLSNLTDEGVLWTHEYGHNTGLPHASDFRRIMYGTLHGLNNGVSQGECDSYHSPPFPWITNPVLADTGACADGDGDEVHDGVDNCPGAANPGQTDSDADAWGDPCDNCPSTANGDQSDFDTDGAGDACDADDDNDGTADTEDCAPLDPAAARPPGEPQDLGWSAGSKTTLTWSPGEHSDATNLYRGDLGSSFEPRWSCLAAHLPGTSYDDPELPGAGAGFHYLATGENACGESSAGTGSDGSPRQPASCP